MSGIKVNFEIGHVATLKSKQTVEGFTHDWEVFVRGQENADLSHFVDKVVFNLHETFLKPRRVIKEPPYAIKESGYAGFTLPIEIYLKNKDEPKKITFSYEFTLQDRGCLKDRYVFQNPNEEFRKKLLRGGGIPVSNNAFYTNPDQESRSRDSFTEEKQQLVSKPKLSSDSNKKHKIKEHKEEVPHKTSCFENLFGPPLQKPPKVSPDPKKNDKLTAPTKIEKKEKERSSSDKKPKHELKEAKSDKIKIKEEKDKSRSDKSKNHSKESKDRSNKRANERQLSPDISKKQRLTSPVRRLPSPPRSSSASSVKEDYKPPKHNAESIALKKQKIEEKAPDIKIEKETKEKKKKDKKSHDKSKERKEKKEHKKESHKLKESPKEPPKEKETSRIRDLPKERESVKDSPTIKEKPLKPEKTINKFSVENLRKTPDNEDRSDNYKQKEKSDPRKHKHKKKDKKREESREKHKESSKDKKQKHDKMRDIPAEKIEIVERRETPQPKERSMPEPASPISIDTASQCSSKSGLAKMSQVGNEDVNSSHSDSEGSVIGDDEDIKVKDEHISPELIKHEPSPEPEPEIEPEPEPIVEPPPVHKEKSKKHKDKSAKREEKRRKRKAAEEERDSLENIEHRKMIKTEPIPTVNVIADMEHGESSGSTSAETKVQDNGVSSSLGEDAEPGDLSPDYMVQLRDLQQRIMKIKNNEDLERVVNLIAETGRYEVTTQTFDFDLCLLDRSTVQQLIQMVGC